MIREARPEEFVAVMRVLEGALLEIDPDRLRAAIDRGEALVAVKDDRILGALVLDGSHIEAVAVRRKRRGRGIGSALVGAGAARTGQLTAEFDPGVRPFYEALGFEIEPRGEDRLYGQLDGDS